MPTRLGKSPDPRGGAIAERTGKRLMGLAESADLLRLPVEAVRALATAGYLKIGGEDGTGPSFSVSDLKGFLGRNAEMARRALEIFRTAMPEASFWTAEEQQRFVDQSTSRFEAILAVTRAGNEVDESLVDDLRDVGA